jgi:hypothetical protein
VEPPGTPIDSTTPCPQNCRNCHKPTTELKPPVAALNGPGPTNLHHNPGGAVVTEEKCDCCHDPALPHYDQHQIRVCGRCHPNTLLHAIHPAETTCLGCHKPFTQLIYITGAYTTNAAGEPSTRFAPGRPILFRLSYDIVGKAGFQYGVKALVRAFGVDRTRFERHPPGRGYEMVFSGKVPNLAPGSVRGILYQLRLLRAGVVVSSDQATTWVTVKAP